MDYAKAIRVAMEEKDLSSNQVSHETGWSGSYIAACRLGKASPLQRLDVWADVLGLTPSELCKRAETYPDPEQMAGVGK